MNMVASAPARSDLAPAIGTLGARKPIVIAAGGTGGHFFPAEALAAVLLERGRDIVLFTDARSGGAASTVFSGGPVHVLHGAGLAGRGIGQAARAGIALSVGTVQARALLGRLRPSVVVGFGGYPTIAPVLGSRLHRHRAPFILHEQNAVLGRANRALATRAAALALSFSHTTGVPHGARCVWTGNPVRPAITAHAGAPYQPPGDGPIRLLVLGGSLGARVLSAVVPYALTMLPPALRQRVTVTQQCRAEDLPAVRAAYAQAGIPAALSSFFPDVAALLVGAHLVIARAGASTIAELAVIGRPAILVPLPGAIDDHQAANAAALHDGAWLIHQDAFDADAVQVLLEHLLAEPARLVHAADVIAAHGQAHAAEALADLVEHIAAGGLTPLPVPPSAIRHLPAAAP